MRLAEADTRIRELERAAASGDFDADGYADLVVGVPFEKVGTLGQAGWALVLRGSAVLMLGSVPRLARRPRIAGA